MSSPLQLRPPKAYGTTDPHTGRVNQQVSDQDLLDLSGYTMRGYVGRSAEAGASSGSLQDTTVERHDGNANLPQGRLPPQRRRNAFAQLDDSFFPAFTRRPGRKIDEYCPLMETQPRREPNMSATATARDPFGPERNSLRQDESENESHSEVLPTSCFACTSTIFLTIREASTHLNSLFSRGGLQGDRDSMSERSLVRNHIQKQGQTE